MTTKKILILKNARGGDLFTSLRLISSLNIKNNKIRLYLSELNNCFAFLFKNIEIIKIKYDLKISNRINIFLDILKNKYDEIYILSPKTFYFFLPFIFRKIKFFAIVYNGKKRNRPMQNRCRHRFGSLCFGTWACVCHGVGNWGHRIQANGTILRKCFASKSFQNSRYFVAMRDSPAMTCGS